MRACGPVRAMHRFVHPPPSPPALSLPAEVALGVKAVFQLLFGYCAPVLDLQGHRFVRSFVLPPTACAEPCRPPWVRLSDFVPILAPLHRASRRILGFVAARRLARRTLPYGASLSLERSRTYDFHCTLPRGPTGNCSMLQAASGEGLVIQVSALVSSVSGSLRQGPGKGLPPPV